jgi:glycosyltransferase involved in cell wall biosynthesis
MKSLKIAMLFDDLTIRGGGQRLLLSLARELRNDGHRVTLFTPIFDPSACYPELCEGLDIRAIATGKVYGNEVGRNWMSRNKKKVWQHFFEPRLLARLVDERFDILNPHERPAHRAAVYLKRRCGTPIVWMFNDPASWEINYYENASMPLPVQRAKAAVLRRTEQSLVRQIDAVAVLSHGVQAIFHREFGVYPSVVRCGLDKDFLLSPGSREEARRLMQIGPKTILVLFLAVLSPSRRVEDLLRAIKLVRSSGRDAKLVVVGSSRAAPEYLAQLQRETEVLGITPDVKFIPRSVSEEERRDLYYACDVFVWPNEAQSWGLAPLEAMVCGKPAIVSIGAGVHEVLRDGEQALLVPPRRPELLAKALARLIDHPWLRERIASQGASFVRGRFTWRELSSQMLGLFEQVLDDSSILDAPVTQNHDKNVDAGPRVAAIS